MSKTIGDRIKEKRLQRELTLEELGKFIGVSKVTIHKYESNLITNIPSDKIEVLAKVLNVTPAYLMGWENDLSNFKSSELQLIGNVDIIKSYPYIPNPVSAGVPITMEGIMSLDTISMPDHILGKYSDNKNILMMRVNGESMNNIIPNNSLIAVYYNYPIENLKNGDIIVFSKDYDYSLKHFYDVGDKLIFKPNSSDISFSDIVVNKDETVNIIGKVVMYIRVFE